MGTHANDFQKYFHMYPHFRDPTLDLHHKLQKLSVILVVYVDDSQLKEEKESSRMSYKFLQRLQSRDRKFHKNKWARINTPQYTEDTVLNQKYP